MNRATKIYLPLLVVGMGLSIYILNDESREETVTPAAVKQEPDDQILQKALLEQVRTKPETVEQVAEPMAEAPAPVVAETQMPSGVFPRQAAPDLNPAQLSPALSRTYSNYSALRTETYRNPDSKFNRSVVADLEATRKARIENK